MRHYFIDLENVRSAGLDGVLSLTEDDRVYVFYSDNANTLTIPTLESISRSKAVVKYTKINCYGSNAMDFQIVAMFGAMIEREKKGSFYIISHDNGFKSAVSFCKSFFEGLDITLGWYPKIKDTLVKESSSVEDENAEEKPKVGITGKPLESGEKKKKPSRRKKQSSKKEAESETLTETVSAKTEAASETETAAKTKTSQPKTTDKDSGNASQGEKTEKKSRRLTDRIRKKNKVTPESSPENEKANEPDGKPEDYDYIYKALAEYLSDKTIALYAAAIHEGLIKSKNREALKKYFDSKYQGREGEALYTIIQGRFEKLRGEAKKKK